MNILSRLEEHADYYDLQAMDTLVESLSPAELEENKKGIIGIYNMVFASGMYDLDCDKVNDREDFIFFLLRLISSVQRFYPDQLYYQEQGRCYGNLADGATAYDDKLRYLQQCLHFFKSAPQTTAMQLSMVRALINKMEITRQYTTEAFTELLTYLRPVLKDAALVTDLIPQCFRIRSLPFEQNLHWFQRLLEEVENALQELAHSQPLVYLNWAEAYHTILLNNTADIDPAYKATLVVRTASLLKPLAAYYTTDTDLLYRLGKAFADTAQSSTDNALSLVCYKTAVDYFLKSHEQQPQGIWNFPVYAITTLLHMAQIYHTQGAHEQLIDTFEKGLSLFSQAHEEDYMLTQYWGDFLIEYSRLAYNYQSPSLNRRAEEKLQLAIALIWKYNSHPNFSRPYFSLARLAIKSGDKEKCVSLLQQCQEAIRAKGYVGYDLSEALADDNFREVWERLK